jgi:hypothetical protein
MKNYQNSENFSLSEGGPFHNALVKMRLSGNQGKLVLMGLCLTWLPLVIITFIEGTLYSGIQLSFLKDVAMQARLLVALPILIMIKPVIDHKVVEVTKYLSEALMSPEDRHDIVTRAFHRAKKLTSSALTEVILLLIVIGLTISLVKGGVYSALEGGTTSWMASNKSGNQSLSFSGDWAVFFSIPVFSFLLIRWLWRYLIWMLLLFRLSKSRLNLLATHPDRAGGLGIIILAQRNFNLIFVAGSAVISGQLMAQLMKYPDSFNTIRNLGIAYIVLCLALVLFPLVFFMGKLVTTKQQGLLRLSKLGATLSDKFEREWENELPIERRISEKQVDPSMIYDYAGIYDSLQRLRTIPVTIREIIGMALALFIPFIPILFIHFSVAELLKKIFGMLI